MLVSPRLLFSWRLVPLADMSRSSALHAASGPARAPHSSCRVGNTSCMALSIWQPSEAGVVVLQATPADAYTCQSVHCKVGASVLIGVWFLLAKGFSRGLFCLYGLPLKYLHQAHVQCSAINHSGWYLAGRAAQGLQQQQWSLASLFPPHHGLRTIQTDVRQQAYSRMRWRSSTSGARPLSLCSLCLPATQAPLCPATTAACLL
jgi:hypothetical protein